MSSGFTCNIGQKMPENWAYDQFHEVSDAASEYSGIGYDKIIASPRKTATKPSEFITYDSDEYPDSDMDFLKIRMLYEYAGQYLSINTPSIFEINQLVVRYLSYKKYGGFAWDTLAGSYETGFSHFIDVIHTDETIDLDPEHIFILEDFTKEKIEIQHFAATLGTYQYNTLPAADEKYIDAFAGWAGDLAQMGGILGQTMRHGLPNYFNLEILKKCIGFMDSELSNYTFKYEVDGNVVENGNSGFEFQDMIQDVDAFNMYKGYSFHTTPIYEVFEHYYIVGKAYKRRFQIFETNITSEFNKDRIEQVASIFTKPDSYVVALDAFFSWKFGSYDHEMYGDILAKAFEEKIQYFIQMERNIL